MLFNTLRIIAGLLGVALLSLGVLYGAHAAENDVPPKNATLVYVGTYTGAPQNSKGIYLFWLRTEGKELSTSPPLVALGVAAETPNPSFLTLDAKRRLLFCANETDSFEGKPGGGVSAFSIDATTGKLKLINQQSSKGGGPCQLILDKTGRNILVANYNDGSVAVLPVDASGRLGEATCLVKDTGKGPNAKRQEGPHAHCVTMSPDNQFAFVCDLGSDKVMSYKFDAERGKLTPNDSPFFSVKPGAGPRHLVFHPNGKFAYLINELDSTITTLTYDTKAGVLSELQTISSLPPYYHGRNTAGEIGIVPSGKFLFASNRGSDSVELFTIDSKKGTLTLAEDQKSGGETPRHFGIQPSGEHLAICNQNSYSIRLCRINATTGRLEPYEFFAVAPSPSCAVFLPPAGND